MNFNVYQYQEGERDVAYEVFSRTHEHSRAEFLVASVGHEGTLVIPDHMVCHLPRIIAALQHLQSRLVSE